MLEVHDLPTADVYSATYYTFTEATLASPTRTRSNGTALAKVVLIERSGMLENGLIGIKRFAQISTPILATKPKEGDQIFIDSQLYKITGPLTRKSPAFKQFWEAEIKTTK